MGTAKDVLKAYQQLSPDEQSKVLSVLNHLNDDEWDRQIAADAESGKLDFLLEEALQAEKKGQLKDLCA